MIKPSVKGAGASSISMGVISCITKAVEIAKYTGVIVETYSCKTVAVDRTTD